MVVDSEWLHKVNEDLETCAALTVTQKWRAVLWCQALITAGATRPSRGAVPLQKPCTVPAKSPRECCEGSFLWANFPIFPCADCVRSLSMPPHLILRSNESFEPFVYTCIFCMISTLDQYSSQKLGYRNRATPDVRSWSNPFYGSTPSSGLKRLECGFCGMEPPTASLFPLSTGSPNSPPISECGWVSTDGECLGKAQCWSHSCWDILSSSYLN